MTHLERLDVVLASSREKDVLAGALSARGVERVGLEDCRVHVRSED